MTKTLRALHFLKLFSLDDATTEIFHFTEIEEVKGFSVQRCPLSLKPWLAWMNRVSVQPLDVAQTAIVSHCYWVVFSLSLR